MSELLFACHKDIKHLDHLLTVAIACGCTWRIDTSLLLADCLGQCSLGNLSEEVQSHLFLHVVWLVKETEHIIYSGHRLSHWQVEAVLTATLGHIDIAFVILLCCLAC